MWKCRKIFREETKYEFFARVKQLYAVVTRWKNVGWTQFAAGCNLQATIYLIIFSRSEDWHLSTSNKGSRCSAGWRKVGYQSCGHVPPFNMLFCETLIKKSDASQRCWMLTNSCATFFVMFKLSYVKIRVWPSGNSGIDDPAATVFRWFQHWLYDVASPRAAVAVMTWSKCGAKSGHPICFVAHLFASCVT